MRLFLFVFLTTTMRSPVSSLVSGFVSTRTSTSSYSSSVLLRRRPMPSSATISMHMGHSHSHHEHQYSSSNSKETAALRPILQPQQQQQPIPIRRQAALVVFAAVVVLAPQVYFRKQPLSSAHWALFGVTCASLQLINLLRQSFQSGFEKFRRFRQRFLAHTPRFTSITNWNKYLFHNPNAADRVTLLGVAINLILSVTKVIVGVLCHSSALIADAGHSLSDLFSDFVTLYSVQLARLPPDDDHPYGHGKFEAVGSLFLALTLLITGVGVGTVANNELLQILRQTSVSSTPQLPTFPALLAAAVSIVSKEWLYRITRRVGEDMNSQVVIANAWHHRSDAYSSVLALLSIGLAMYVPGMLAADSAAGLLVAGMICMTGADILGESIDQLTDTAVDADLEHHISDIAADHGDVIDVTQIRARQVGSKAFIDASVEIPADFTGSAIRAVEEQVRQKILAEPNIMDAVVRATSKPSENVVICPLLKANQDRIQLPTVTEVEHNIRQVLHSKHNNVVVKTVMVHYDDPTSIHVDVCIQLDPSSSTMSLLPQTISSVRDVAEEIRTSIETCQDYIQQANIFLDLNTVESVPKPTYV